MKAVQASQLSRLQPLIYLNIYIVTALPHYDPGLGLPLLFILGNRHRGTSPPES
jgi:hypothetical protein